MSPTKPLCVLLPPFAIHSPRNLQSSAGYDPWQTWACPALQHDGGDDHDRGGGDVLHEVRCGRVDLLVV